MRNPIARIVLIFLIIPILSYSQDSGASMRTSFIFQKWDIEKVDDSITEGTFPIEVNYPIRENINLQLNHFPALSKFGKNELAGLSDTWLRANYSFADDRALASFGIGIPTGKTELDSSEIVLARLLSEQSFKFQLPVYGQGLTVSGGVMYAMPVSEKITIGAGLNFVLRNAYKFSTMNSVEYNPGEQFGINVGFDYVIMENLTSNVDIVYNYYTSDKMKDEEIFTSGPRISSKIGLMYQQRSSYYWIRAAYQAKAKNEFYIYTLNNKLEQKQKIPNITIRELHIGSKFQFTEKLLFSVVGEVRSYVGYKKDRGWADLYGGGVVGEYYLMETFSLFSGLKFFFGDGEFSGITPDADFGGITPKVQGLELQIGSQWNF
ncbi:hypothetical protein ISS22_17170 [candidate division KSB1 bacterium]|nr:hypothetical protein [candidate division KSB1 bacterium]